MTGNLKIQELRALALAVELPNGLVIDEVQLESTGIAVDLGEKSIPSGVKSRVTATVSPEALQSFLAIKLPAQVQNPRVQFSANQIEIRVQVNFVISMPVTLVTELEVIEGRELNVKLISVDKPGPVYGITQNQLAQMNPVLDLKKAPEFVRIESVSLSEEGLNVCVEANATRAVRFDEIF